MMMSSLFLTMTIFLQVSVNSYLYQRFICSWPEYTWHQKLIYILKVFQEGGFPITCTEIWYFLLSEWMEFPVCQWKTRHDLLQKVHWNMIKKIFFPYKYHSTSLSKRKKCWRSHFLYYWQNWYFQNI